MDIYAMWHILFSCWIRLLIDCPFPAGLRICRVAVQCLRTGFLLSSCAVLLPYCLSGLGHRICGTAAQCRRPDFLVKRR